MIKRVTKKAVCALVLILIWQFLNPHTALASGWTTPFIYFVTSPAPVVYQGDKVSVNLYVQTVNVSGLRSGELNFQFDDTLLKFTGTEWGSGIISSTEPAVNGLLHTIFAKTTGTFSAGDFLVKVNFEVKSPVGKSSAFVEAQYMVKESWLSSLSTTYYWGVTETQSFLVVNPNAVTFTPTPVTPVAVTTTPTPTSSPTPTLTQTPTSTPTFTSTPAASSSPTATFTATTTPVVNNQISWKIDQTTLESNKFYILFYFFSYY